MVEVFKTNVQESTEANRLLGLLTEYFPDARINFDLDDCDRILRLEGLNIAPHKVMNLVSANGFVCNVLE